MLDIGYISWLSTCCQERHKLLPLTLDRLYFLPLLLPAPILLELVEIPFSFLLFLLFFRSFLAFLLLFAFLCTSHQISKLILVIVLL